MKIEVYTDGGAIPNPGRAGWGVVFVVDGKQKKTLSGEITFASNNVAELWAAIRAVESFTRPSTFTLYSDSQYLIKSMTEWIPQRGYENHKNAAHFGRLIDACKPHTIDWQWVRSHNGNPFNELADHLAHARIFDGRVCECGQPFTSESVTFDWQRKTMACQHCGLVSAMREVMDDA